MPPGKLYVRTKGLYIPPRQKFATETNFFFCASFLCFHEVLHSNIIVTPNTNTIFEVEESTVLSEEDCELLSDRGFKLW